VLWHRIVSYVGANGSEEQATSNLKTLKMEVSCTSEMSMFTYTESRSEHRPSDTKTSRLSYLEQQSPFVLTIKQTHK
jgi:hypothetical protein